MPVSRPRSPGIATLGVGRVVAAVLCAVLLPGALSAQVGGPELPHSPFRTMERSPLYRISHTPTAEPADLLAAGQIEVNVATTYSNILEWVREPRTELTLDMERWINQVELRWAFADGWEAGTRLSARTDWGGFLDGFVQWWHARIGLPNGDREKVEDGEFDSEVRRDGAEVFRQTSGTRLEDPVLQLARQLIRRPEGALALRLSTKVPLGSSGTHSGEADLALQIDGRRSWTRWHLFGGAGWTTLRAPEALEPFARDHAWVGHVGVERDFGPLAAQVQFQGGTAYYEGFDNRELDRAPTNLAVGATFDLAGWRWEAAFVEDIRPNSPSVDFTLDVRLRRLLAGG